MTIRKKIKITKDSAKVEFDLSNQLPQGEYEVELFINANFNKENY